MDAASETRTSYSYSVTLARPFDEVLQKTREALKSNGMGIISEIDFQKAFKEKIGKDIRKHVQLGACQPLTAYQIVTAEPSFSTLLPCSVSVIEHEGGKTEVAFKDPKAMFEAFMRHAPAEMTAIVEEVDVRMRAAMKTLQ